MRLATILTTLTLLLVCTAGAARAQSPEGTLLVDDFEWATGVDPASYTTALDDRGWEPRSGAGMEITISNDARVGDYALQYATSRRASDYIIISLEGNDTYTNWSDYSYISFWARASADVSAETDAFQIRTRDVNESWGRMDPIDLGTDWQYVVYRLPEPDAMIDELRYVRFYADTDDEAVPIPFTVWIDHVEVHQTDPRGASEVLETFEWAELLYQDQTFVVDSLFDRNWKTRVRDKNEAGVITTFYPDVGIISPGANGSDYALRVTPNRVNQDRVEQVYEYEDESGVKFYADWSQYNYLSFYVRSDSTWRSPFKMSLRDAIHGYQDYNESFPTPRNDGTAGDSLELADMSEDWRLVVLPLNESSDGDETSIEREQLRYVQFKVYSDNDRPPTYNIYIDDVMVSAWDPRDPQPAATVGVEEEGGVMPQGFALHQNFPNPFNPSTQIRFTMEQAGTVDLAVYDLLGRKVATLVDGRRLAPGAHQVQWDAGADGAFVASGVYLYRLSVDGRQMVRTMTLLK